MRGRFTGSGTAADGGADLARGSRGLPPRLVPARSRDAGGRRRRLARGDRAEARGALRELAARRGAAASRSQSRARPRRLPAVYLIDRPGAQQSLIVAGHLAPPKSDPRDVAFDAFNQLLGGSFSGRINMNLREDKHWSYGAYSLLFDARGERPVHRVCPGADRSHGAGDGRDPARARGRAGAAARPPRTSSRARKDQATLTLPGRWETSEAVAQDVAEQVRFGLPDDYWSGYAGRVRALDLAQVTAAGKALVAPRAAGLAGGGRPRRDRAGDPRARPGRAARADADGSARAPRRSRETVARAPAAPAARTARRRAAPRRGRARPRSAIRGTVT